MKSIRWVCTVIFALVAAGLVALGSARPARADAIVNPCTDAGLGTALASGGLITFNCGGPATRLTPQRLLNDIGPRLAALARTVTTGMTAD